MASAPPQTSCPPGDYEIAFSFTEAGTYYIKELKAPTENHLATPGVKTIEVKAKWTLEERDGLTVIVQELSAGIVGLATQAGGLCVLSLRVLRCKTQLPRQREAFIGL